MTTLVSQWSRSTKKAAYLINSWIRACIAHSRPSSRSQADSKSWANLLADRKSLWKLPTASPRKQPTQHREQRPHHRTWLTLTQLSRPRAWCNASCIWWSSCSATRSKPTTSWSKRLAPLARNSTPMQLLFACLTSEKVSNHSAYLDEDRSWQANSNQNCYTNKDSPYLDYINFKVHLEIQFRLILFRNQV